MEFSLSKEVIHEIIFAMENQTSEFLFDSQDLNCCSIDKIQDLETSEVKSRFYKIPQWNSASGFRVMEQFVSSLHNPTNFTLIWGIVPHAFINSKTPFVLTTWPTNKIIFSERVS